MFNKKENKLKNKKASVSLKIKKKKKINKLLSKERTLCIKNLAFKSKEKDILEYLKKFGNISEVKLLKRGNGRSKGKGFVKFEDESNAAKAIKNCSGKDFMGRIIKINFVDQQNTSTKNVKVKDDKKEQNISKEDVGEKKTLKQNSLKQNKIISTESLVKADRKRKKKFKNAEQNSSTKKVKVNHDKKEDNTSEEHVETKKPLKQNSLKQNKIISTESLVEADRKRKRKFKNAEQNTSTKNVKVKDDKVQNTSEEDVGGKKLLKQTSLKQNKIEIINTETLAKTDKKRKKKLKNSRKGRLIVRNLSFKVNEAILREHFKKFGEISEVTLLRKGDGKLVGCGFIQFVKKNHAAKAIVNCSGKPLLGRTIIVDWAVSKTTFANAEDSSDNEKSEVKIKTENSASDSETNNQNSEIEEVVIKDEILSEDEREKSTDSDENSFEDSEKNDDDDDDDDDNDNVKEEMEDEEKNKNSDAEIEKQKRVSNDVAEGRTVFIKNIPFLATNEELKACMEQYGRVFYALICVDRITEHSKGTGFVKFQTQESAEECLKAGTELTLHDQTLDVYRALNKNELEKKKEKNSNEVKDSRNLYLIKEGAVMAGSKAAEGVSVADMSKRLQLEQWKSQMLRNLHMFVSRYRLVIYNIPLTWTDIKLRQLFLQHTSSDAVVKEARIMRDMKNIDALGIGKSKEFGFVSFSKHEDALQALRNINNNPNIFTTNKRPIVAFSIENKAIINLKQKRLERSRIKNPLYSKEEDTKKHWTKKSKFSKNKEESNYQEIRKNNNLDEATQDYAGITAKPGKTSLRSKFKLKSQAEAHRRMVKNCNKMHKNKLKFQQQKQINREKVKNMVPKKEKKIKNDDKEFNSLVSNYKKKLMAAPMKKWYDE